MRQNSLLFRKTCIKRYAGGGLQHQCKVRRIEPLERRTDIGWNEIHRVDRIIGREVAAIERLKSSCPCFLTERGVDHPRAELRLMVAVAHDEKGVGREFLGETVQ